MHIFLAIVALILLAFLVLHIYVYGGLWVHGLLLRRRLRQCGRVMSRAQAQERIEKGEGTILVEYPTMGWNVARIWWSAETEWEDQHEAPESHRFATPTDHLYYDRFVSEETGEALLVSGYVWTQFLPKRLVLMSSSGMIESPIIFTGGVLMDRDPRSQMHQSKSENL